MGTQTGWSKWEREVQPAIFAAEELEASEHYYTSDVRVLRGRKAEKAIEALIIAGKNVVVLSYQASCDDWMFAPTSATR